MKSNNNIEKVLADLETGIQELFESEKYKNYLNTMSKFYNYSLNNCMLIAMQKPEATLVASYSCWKDKFQRYVLKGEKGITIIAPAPFKKEIEKQAIDSSGNLLFDENGKPVLEKKEMTFNSFKTVKVFDISQTDGEPIPEIVSELSDPVKDFDIYLESIEAVSPVKMRFDDIASGANGYYSPSKQEIVIKRAMPEEQTIKTFIHEVAHATLGHGSETDIFDRKTKEVQAESVAYCVSKSLGLNTEEYSFGYIAGWSSGRDLKELKGSLQIIKTTSEKLISGISEKMDAIKMEHQKYTLMHSLNVDGPAMKISM